MCMEAMINQLITEYSITETLMTNIIILVIPNETSLWWMCQWCFFRSATSSSWYQTVVSIDRSFKCYFIDTIINLHRNVEKCPWIEHDCVHQSKLTLINCSNVWFYRFFFSFIRAEWFVHELWFPELVIWMSVITWGHFECHSIRIMNNRKTLSRISYTNTCSHSQWFVIAPTHTHFEPLSF